jgi:hypothetical protein
MSSVPPFGARPTNLAPLPRLLAYAQGLGLDRHLCRANRGIPTLELALIWLVLAWRGTGRPERLDRLDEPLLAALLGRERRPTARTLLRSPANATRLCTALQRAIQEGGESVPAYDDHTETYRS